MFDNNEHFLTNLQPILELFPASIRNQQGVYLVGGCVRDAWLGKASHDIDLVVMGDVHKAARQTARHLEGACFLLDEERNTWRVLGNCRVNCW